MRRAATALLVLSLAGCEENNTPFDSGPREAGAEYFDADPEYFDADPPEVWHGGQQDAEPRELGTHELDAGEEPDAGVIGSCEPEGDVTEPPQLLEFSPRAGCVGARILMLGRHLGTGACVTLGGVVVQGRGSATGQRFTIPALAPGSYAVEARTAQGTATSTTGITISAGTLPVITSITPVVPQGGTLTLEGEGLGPAQTVTIVREPNTGVSYSATLTGNTGTSAMFTIAGDLPLGAYRVELSIRNCGFAQSPVFEVQ